MAGLEQKYPTCCSSFAGVSPKNLSAAVCAQAADVGTTELLYFNRWAVFGPQCVFEIVTEGCFLSVARW